jgi:hypothetical protein
MDLLIGFLPHGELQGDPPGKSSCPLDGDHPAVPGCLLFGLSGSSPDGIATSVCAKKKQGTGNVRCSEELFIHSI